MKNIIDLSIDLKNGMPYYPGDPVPEFSPALGLERDGCRVMNLNIGSHTGTHIDAPSHFLKDGKTIEQIELSKCMGFASIIKLTHLEPYHKIMPCDIEPFLPFPKNTEIILLYTGWTDKYGTAEFYRHPYLSMEVCGLFVKNGIKAVGVDMLNVDRTAMDGELYSDSTTAAHQILLNNEIIIIENLTNLGSVNCMQPYVMFVPLKIDGADGSPVRAFAVDFED